MFLNGKCRFYRIKISKCINSGPVPIYSVWAPHVLTSISVDFFLRKTKYIKSIRILLHLRRFSVIIL